MPVYVEPFEHTRVDEGPFARLHYFSEEQKKYAVRLLRYLSKPLHHSTKTKPCKEEEPCAMCVEATRLAVQHLVPEVVDRTVKKIHRAVGWSCPQPPTGPDY